MHTVVATEMMVPEILQPEGGPKVVHFTLPEESRLPNPREPRLMKARRVYQTVGKFDAHIHGEESTLRPHKEGDPIPQDLSSQVIGLTFSMMEQDAQVGRLTLDQDSYGKPKRELIIIEAPEIRRLTFEEGYPNTLLGYDPETAGKTDNRLAFLFNHNPREFQILGYANGGSPDSLVLQAIDSRKELADGLVSSPISEDIRPRPDLKIMLTNGVFSYQDLNPRPKSEFEHLTLYALQVLFKYGLEGIIPGQDGLKTVAYKMVSYGNLFEGYMNRLPLIEFSFFQSQEDLKVSSELSYVFDNNNKRL